MATSVTGPDSNGTIRRMIQSTIDRLQRSSIRPDDLGNRYSRMLRLLWRKIPHSKEGSSNGQDGGHSPSRDSKTPPPSTALATNDQPVSLSAPSSSQPGVVVTGVAGPLPPQQGQTERPVLTANMGRGQGNDQVLLGAFSWRDLDAVGQFATNNNSVDGLSVLSGNSGQFGVGEGEDPFAYLSAENQNAMWFDLGLSPGNVIF